VSRLGTMMLCAMFVFAQAGRAQDPMKDLAMASQNPIGSLISVPFQNNFNFGSGVPGRLQYVLNVQPVIPVSVSRDWRLVSRLIVPTIQQPLGKDNSEVGLGDAVLELFAAPTSPLGDHGLVVGAGPAFTFPTATDPVLGAERWSAGPTAVIVVAPDNWVAGVLAVQQWSFAGKHDRAVVAPFTFQPFVNYNLPRGWAIMSAPIITADWMAGDDAWFVPVGGGVSRTMKAGFQPVTLSGQVYVNVLRPEGSPDWNLRLNVSLLFPRQ
jgi:hypothetical protein